MRIRVFLALAGLAIGLALPAQQTNTPDSKLRQRLVMATPAASSILIHRVTRDLGSRRVQTTWRGTLLSKRLNGGFRLDVVSTRTGVSTRHKATTMMSGDIVTKTKNFHDRGGTVFRVRMDHVKTSFAGRLLG